MAGHRGPGTFRACVLAAAVTAASLWPAAARADEPLAPEVDTNPATAPSPSARTNLILVGAAVTAGWYGAAYGTSYLWADSDGASKLRIPVAGPYMALAKTGCGDREPTCDTLTLVLRTTLTTLSLVGQTGGVLAMLEGVFVPTGVFSSPTPPKASERKTIHIAVAPGPTSANGLGFGVFGEF